MSCIRIHRRTTTARSILGSIAAEGVKRMLSGRRPRPSPLLRDRAQRAWREDASNSNRRELQIRSTGPPYPDLSGEAIEILRCSISVKAPSKYGSEPSGRFTYATQPTNDGDTRRVPTTNLRQGEKSAPVLSMLLRDPGTSDSESNARPTKSGQATRIQVGATATIEPMTEKLRGEGEAGGDCRCLAR